jgi:hypoxanthine phosphoribosyltransferase
VGEDEMSWPDILSILSSIIGIIASIYGVFKFIQKWKSRKIRNFTDFERDLIRLLKRINKENYSPDIVLGIGRSGALVGGWLAGNLGSKPIEIIERLHTEKCFYDFLHINKKINFIKESYGSDISVLVVQGATANGGSFSAFEGIQKELAPDWKVKYAVVYEVDSCRFDIPFEGMVIDKIPEKYPWHWDDKYQKAIRGRKRVD